MHPPSNNHFAAGRMPTQFSAPGAIPVMVSTFTRQAKQPQLKPSPYFEPVSPNKMKPRFKQKPPRPGEVDSNAPPMWMDHLPPPFADEIDANNVAQQVHIFISSYL